MIAILILIGISFLVALGSSGSAYHEGVKSLGHPTEASVIDEQLRVKWGLSNRQIEEFLAITNFKDRADYLRRNGNLI